MSKHKRQIGTLVQGKVIQHKAFGFFVDIDDPIWIGLVQITDIKDKNVLYSEGVSTEDYPDIGTLTEAVVLGYTDDDRKQIWLSIRPSVIQKAKEI